MKRIISIFLFISLMGMVCMNVFAYSGKKTKDVPKVNVTMPFTKGLNLSTWLEPFGVSNANSTYFGKSDFEDIKSLGVEILRIPIHFEEWSSGAPDYVIPEWLWKKIDDAIAWCTELEMYMIIDFHNDCNGKSKTRPDIESVLLKIWPQIANRYKDSGKYVLYEIMNEPHMKSGNIQADLKKWGKIQGNILKVIREIDKTHTVIVGAENWNSLDGLFTLPDYNDDNLIYNFHDYSPFLFTHQGASWTDIERLKNIPFPYVKEKMPPLPKNPTDSERWNYENYKWASQEQVLVEPLNRIVDFANTRNVALMCNEYGVYMNHADNEERTNWYRMKAKWMEERGIVRVSWDYKGGFGVFNKGNGNFPEDLNTVLLEGMGFKIPPMEKRKKISWLEQANATGNYAIYKNAFADNIRIGGWVDSGKKKVDLQKIDYVGSDSYIYVPQAKAYNSIHLDFNNVCDFTSLVEQGKKLEFEVRTKQKDLSLNVYFKDKEDKSAGKIGKEWRSGIFIRNDRVPADNQWHKISVPLKEFVDYGAWDNDESRWYNAEKLFRWNKIESLVLDFAEIDVTSDICIRNIEIK